MIPEFNADARTDRLYHCKYGNFRENFISANSVKIHICLVKKSRLRRDLPISVHDRVISSFREGFIFAKLRTCEVSRKLNLLENFRIYSIDSFLVAWSV